MATCGIIARKTSGGFEGRYHHWDSYPDGLGRALYRMYHEHFQQDIQAMLHFLIDEHQAGWSTLVETDLAMTPGWTTFVFEEPCPEPNTALSQVLYQDWQVRYTHALARWEATDGRRPRCYCHGLRHEEGRLITALNQEPDAEYLYVIDAGTCLMEIYQADDSKRLLGVVALDGPEPDWAQVQEA